MSAWIRVVREVPGYIQEEAQNSLLGPGGSRMNAFKCIECFRDLPSVRKQAGNSKYTCRSICKHCKFTADKYVNEAGLFLADLLHFRKKALVHLLFNIEWHRYNAVVCTVYALALVLAQWENLRDSGRVCKVLLLSLVEPVLVFLSLLLGRRRDPRVEPVRALRAYFVLSAPLLLKTCLVLVPGSSLAALGAQMVDFLTFLYVVQGLSLFLMLESRVVFGLLVVLRAYLHGCIHGFAVA